MEAFPSGYGAVPTEIPEMKYWPSIYVSFMVSLLWWGCVDTTRHRVNRENGEETQAASDGVIIRDMTLLDMGRLDTGMSSVDQMISPSSQLCDHYLQTPVSVVLSDHLLPEASGLAMSALTPNVLWSHNDSGSEADVFALRVDGTLLGRLQLPRATVDLEDIDGATCPHRSGYCLWVGDIGDNQKERDTLRIWVVSEPPTSVPFDPILLTMSQIPQLAFPIDFRLEGGAADLEALVVDQQGQKIWLLEKREQGSSRVWGLDLEAEGFLERVRSWSREGIEWSEQILLARLITQFNAPGLEVPLGRMITAADLSPDGMRLLLRVYTGIFEYRFTTPYHFEELGDLVPKRIAWGPLNEPQGEAVSYGWMGEGVWSLSEHPDPPQPLNYFSCMDHE